MKQKINFNQGLAALRLIIIAALASALVVGTLVFTWQKIAANKEIDKLQKQINDLQTQIQQLQQANNNNSEFTDWQTYRNEQYGFEMKYPEDWVLKEKELFSASPSIILTPKDKPTAPAIFIEVLPNFTGPPPETMGEKIIETENVVIDNYQAVKNLFQGRVPINEDRYYLRVTVSEKNFLIHADLDEDNKEKVISVFDKMLSTFKFID